MINYDKNPFCIFVNFNAEDSYSTQLQNRKNQHFDYLWNEIVFKNQNLWKRLIESFSWNWSMESKNSVKFHGKIYKLFHFGAVCFHHSILCIFLRCRYDDIIPLAKNCTEIYVWHTMTFTLPYRQLHLENLNAINDADTNLPKLLENTT